MLDAIDSTMNAQLLSKEVRIEASLNKEVKPLITTKWDQRDPFNRLCPMIDGKRTLTGCTATALAQFFHYFRVPTKGKGSISYEYESDNGKAYTNSVDLTLLQSMISRGDLSVRCLHTVYTSRMEGKWYTSNV